MNEEREKSNLPPLPTAEEVREQQEGFNFLVGDNWMYDDVAPYLLDFREQYKPPRYTLSWKSIPFAPLGGIHNITGQSGNGKTMTIAQFMATILSGEFGQLKYELSAEIPKPKVLYIDTEMEKDNTIAVKNRVLSMAGRDINGQYDDFVIVMLRDVAEVPELDKNGKPVLDKHGRPVFVNPAVVRWRMTLKAIWQFKPTAVFIDGLLDVVADFNDNIECQELIFKCMKVASHYDISLWCILHQNPGGEKLVGHLGSFLERKVTDVIQTSKKKNETTGEITFEVKQKKARSRDFDDWKFRVLPVDSWGMPEQILPAPVVPKYSIEKIKEWLTQYQAEVEWPATLTDIRMKIFKAKCCITNSDELQECVTMATNRKLLVAQSDDEYAEGQKHPKYYLNRNEIPDDPF